MTKTNKNEFKEEPKDFNDETLNDITESNESFDENIGNEVVYYLDMAQRLKADFENYKKRNSLIAQTSYTEGVIFAVEKILPVIDSFNQGKSKITDIQVLQGIDIIYNQFITVLQSIGVNKIEALNKEFDPNFHNAVMTESNNDLPNNIITQELQQGFTYGDKVIRYSMVKINKI